MLPYLGSLITEDGEYTIEFCTRLNQAGDQSITAENMEKSHSSYSICGCAQQHVYQKPVNDVDNLKQCLTEIWPDLVWHTANCC